MIFRCPEHEVTYHAAPVALQVIFRDAENVLMEYGIDPIIYRIMIGHTGPVAKSLRRIEIMSGPYSFTKRIVEEIFRRLHAKYGMELILAHRKKFGEIPERLILEIPQTWVEEPRVFLKKYGYIKGGNHA